MIRRGRAKIVEGKKVIKNTPQPLNRRTIKIPRTTRSTCRPGVIMPTPDMTQAQSKRAVQFADKVGRPLCVNEGGRAHEVTEIRGPHSLSDDARSQPLQAQ